MGLTTFVYGSFASKALAKEINLLADDIRFALLTAAHTPDQDVHDYWNDVVANEATGAGWAAGGVALGGKAALAYEPGNNRQRFDANDVSVAGVTVTWRYGVIYDRTPATDATRPLIALVDWGSTQSLVAATLSVVFSVDGFLSAVHQ